MQATHQARGKQPQKSSRSTAAGRSALQRRADESRTTQRLASLQAAVDGGQTVSQLRALQEKAQIAAKGPQPIQRRGANNYDAGTGAGWHIHYGEHVKYNGTDGTRVNFDGRSQWDVRRQWWGKVKQFGLEATVPGADFQACKRWIRRNL